MNLPEDGSAPGMPGKLFIKTFGCQMNEYDTARMADVLRESHGLTPTTDPEEADVLLLNTCSVREKAQEKVFSHLGVWREFKEQRPHVVIGVGGCVASQEGGAILERAPFVDLVFGPQTLHRLPQMLDGVRDRGLPLVDISFPEIEKFDHLPAPRAEGASAYVSVMEGCSRRCTFCVVPYTRGREVSRPADDVIAEVLQLAAQGVREVNLLGQNVNAYRGAGARRQEDRSRRAHRACRRHRGHRAHPFHDLPSAQFRRAAVARPMPTFRSSRRSCTCRCRAAPIASCR